MKQAPSDYTKERFYFQMANHIKGQVKMMRYDCAAHLEDKDDEYFWKRLFERFAPEKRILYITHSRSEKGNKTTGVGHCLNYRNYLNKKFVICIDSDYRRLLSNKERGIDINHYIFQTYTYSFENHHCFPDGIDSIIYNSCKVSRKIVDFHDLLRRYSVILYDAMIWHLYLQRKNERIFTQLEFRQLLSMFNGKVKYHLQQEVEKELSRIARNASAVVRKLERHYPHAPIEELKEEYRKIGLEPDRTYLFVRGHNIFDSLCRLGRGVCEQLLEDEKIQCGDVGEKIKAIYDDNASFKDLLVENLQFSAYQEISWIEEDIKNFFYHSG